MSALPMLHSVRYATKPLDDALADAGTSPDAAAMVSSSSPPPQADNALTHAIKEIIKNLFMTAISL